MAGDFPEVETINFHWNEADLYVYPAVTSREATPLLTRSTDGDIRRTPYDLAQMLAFGAIQWPWLLKSLYGGRKAEKAALLNRLGLDPDALPKLGSWKADVGLLDWIVDHVDRVRPESVVELGAGASTLVIAQAMKVAGYRGRIVSYDQHADFVMATRAWLADHGLSADLRHAPIVSPTLKWQHLWYDLEGIPDSIDMLLIDGPPWTVRPTVRGQAERLFDRVARGGIVILDDAARPGERLVGRQWRRDWPQFDWRFRPSIKGMLIGTRL
jgi:predicted O-methyltransferase YrrM